MAALIALKEAKVTGPPAEIDEIRMYAVRTPGACCKTWWLLKDVVPKEGLLYAKKIDVVAVRGGINRCVRMGHGLAEHGW